MTGCFASISELLDFGQRPQAGNVGAGAVTMGKMTDEQQRVRELFEAHFTIGEIVERTSLEIQTVVRFINAPRVVKRRNACERPLSEVRYLGLAGD